MKILFVDDEKIIREGMRELINWEKLNCTDLVLAENATKAIDILEKQDFDLVITDICMQKMTGIEFAKYIKKTKPHIKVIILSAYENFGYARAAIEAGVFKYILKPVVPLELEDAILEAMELIHSQVKLQNQVQESEKLASIYQPILAKDFWKLLLRGEIQDEKDIIQRIYLSGIILPKGKLGCILLSTRGNGTVITEMHMKSIYLKGESIFDCIQIDRYNIVFISANEMPYEELNRLKTDVEKILNCTVIAVQGNYVDEIKNLNQSYCHAEKSIEFYSAVSMPSSVKEMEDMNQILNSEEIRKITKKLIEDMNYRKQVVIKNITTYYKILHQSKLSNDQLRIAEGRLLFELFQDSKKQKELLNVQFQQVFHNYLKCDSENEKKMFIVNWIQKVIDTRETTVINDTDRLVMETKNIIINNFQDEQLTIKRIALSLHVSTSYLSRIFKKKTGMTCIEYVTGKRIDRAKSLLANTNMKHHQIALEIGYSNVYYFSVHFKKITGETPGQYRKRMEDENDQNN